jgi:hypothetical protein
VKYFFHKFFAALLLVYSLSLSGCIICRVKVNDPDMGYFYYCPVRDDIYTIVNGVKCISENDMKKLDGGKDRKWLLK